MRGKAIRTQKIIPSVAANIHVGSTCILISKFITCIEIARFCLFVFIMALLLEIQSFSFALYSFSKTHPSIRFNNSTLSSMATPFTIIKLDFSVFVLLITVADTTRVTLGMKIKNLRSMYYTRALLSKDLESWCLQQWLFGNFSGIIQNFERKVLLL